MRRTLVRAARTTASRDQVVEAELDRVEVFSERVPIGRIVDEVPPVRVEGDVTIMSVVEEELVLVRRLILKEEVRLRTVRSVHRHVETVVVREQDVSVTRTLLEDLNPAAALVAPNHRKATAMTDSTVVAVYDTPAHAELAAQDLLQAGIPESAIHRHAQEGSYAGSSTAPTARPAETGGFWSSLFGGEPDHDTSVYDRSVQAGSTAVSVTTSGDHVEKAMSILEQHNPIDIDERASSYGLGQTTTTTTTTGMAGTAPLATGTTATGTAATDGGTIQLSEETLAVGKRVINRGTTRIRRFVVETPVEEEIRLRDERVTIERRPVTDDRAVSGADFTDKTIEMTESAEEAVVSKTARVKEEISLRKEATERTETVRDTVRREDVEIEKVPGDAAVDPATRKPLI